MGDTANASSSSNYAFITHSQDTLPQNLPPSIDNASLARRRRRRTSPRDQKILEDEFVINERPDKLRRKALAHQVEMGEKEIQIWFSNKRQQNKRRAKPLLPHERIPRNKRHQLSSAVGMEMPPSQLPPAPSVSPVRRAPPASSPGSEGAFALGSEMSSVGDSSSPSMGVVGTWRISASTASRYATRVAEHVDRVPHRAAAAAAAPSPPIMRPLVPDAKSLMTVVAHDRLQEMLNCNVPPPPPPPSSPAPLPAITIAEATSSRRTKAPANLGAHPPRLLKRSSSNVRLSTTLEGKATVILEPAQTSSPPRPRPSLQTTPTSAPRLSKRPHVAVTDSAVWEACANSQVAAGGVEQPSEATQALQLLRNKSTNLQLFTKKRDPSRLFEKISRKVITAGDKTTKPRPAAPPLSTVIAAGTSNPPKKPLGDGRHHHRRLRPGQEGDKENRPPGAPVSPPPEPGLAAPSSGKVLIPRGGQQRGTSPLNRRALGTSASLQGYQAALAAAVHKNDRSAGTAHSPIYEDRGRDSGGKDDGDDAPSSSYFAGTGSQESVATDSYSLELARTPSRRKDEIECVENLLNLRRGTWR